MVKWKEALAADQVYNSANVVQVLLFKKSLWQDQQVLVHEPWIDMAQIQETSQFHFAFNKNVKRYWVKIFCFSCIFQRVAAF